MMAMPGAGVMQLAALGRPFHLGMLYDSRSDTLIPGVTLWDPSDLEKDRIIRKQNATDFQVIMEDTLSKKSNALDIDASLKLSFLGGLVQVSGSAHYLDDRKSSQHQERVTLKYKATTHFEELTMKHLGKGNMKHMDVFDHGTATHVVTGVRYGGQAFFVFDRNVSSHENQREIAGSLHVLVKALPGIVDIEGKAKVNLTEDERSNANKFECQFYGDFCPNTNPSTYKEAALLYQELPKLLGDDNENAVPLEVWLYPLYLLDSKAARLVRAISEDVVQKVETNLEQLHDIDVRCSDILSSPTCQKFAAIKNDIFYFKERIKQFGLVFKKQLMPILPKIRGGGAEESELISLLKSREESPFSHRHLLTWVEYHEIEVQVLNNYITSMENIAFISKANLAVEVLRPGTEVVVCFMIRLCGEDSQASRMRNYLEDEISSKLRDTQITSTLDTVTNVMVQNARRFQYFAAGNMKTPGMVFKVVEDPDPDGKRGGFIDVYKDGTLIHSDYAPTSQPGQPLSEECHHDALVVSWQLPDIGQQQIQKFEVCYQRFGSSVDDWCTFITQSPQNKVTIPNLVAATTYQLKLRAICDFGFSEYSVMSDPISTRPTSPPGKPEIRQVSPESIMVKWAKPDVIPEQITIDSYMVQMKNMNTNTWLPVKSVSGDNLLLELKVEPRRQYYTQVCAKCKSASSHDSEQSIPFTVEATDADLVKYRAICSSTKVSGSETMPVYQVPLKTVVSQGIEMTRKCIFGKKRTGETEKVIMVVGATGAGKTTLMNGMFNYIMGVDFTDDYRFRLIKEDQASANQARSQTQYITAYTVHHQDGYAVPYTLTIIDTPGFGDTTGIERDQKITKQIHSFFSTTGEGGIDHIDAVGFVTQASLPRLTPTQKYVFDSILSLFGKDIKDNIFLLVTFADGQKPPVLAGVKEAQLMYKKFYKFNNSAIYAENNKSSQTMESDDEDDDDDGDDNFDQMFWDMGMKSFKKFLTGLSKVEPRSLQLTKDVLDERGRLELHVKNIQNDITRGLNKLDQLKIEVAVLKDHAADIDRNKNFKYTVTEDKILKIDIPVGQHTTTCLTCNRTCHEDCGIPDDGNKRGCWAMTNGNCRICPGKCAWNMHKNLRYILTIVQETVTKDSEDLKQRYNEAKGKVLSSEQLVSAACDEFEEIQMKVYYWTDEVRKSIKRLQEIALKPHPLSALEYIDILIQSERNEAKPGWKERVEQLSEVRKNAEYLNSITRKGFDPFEAYKKKVEEERQAGKGSGAFATAAKYLKKLFGTSG